MATGNVADQRYKIAKDYYYRLERDESIGKQRNNWLTGVRNFRKIYLDQTKGPLAPSCLYMMARMHRRMHQQFKLDVDLDEAIVYFNTVATIFPENTLADDALFNTAELYLTKKKDIEQASRLYLQIARQYQQGDLYAQALNRLHELEQKYKIRLPDKLTKSKTRSHLVKVLPIKYWSSSNYTRVVIRASAPVRYKASLLEKKDDKPRRLYIDFTQSHIPPKFRAPVPIQDGLLKQVRSGQFNENTVRVVLDIESISDYKIFSLSDPFRVVVDVHGLKSKRRSNKVVQQALTKKEAKPEDLQKRSSVKTQPHEQVSDHPFISLRDSKKYAPQTPGTTPPGRELSLAQQLGLGVRKIVIDPGHGGRDPGAMAFDLKEKNIVLDISKRIAKTLRHTYKYDVVLTRTKDTTLPLEERTAIANTQNGDLFLSVHINAHPKPDIGGIETFYLNLATNAEAMRVAALENATSSHNISELQDILQELMQNSKINDSSRLAHYIQSNMIEKVGPHSPYRIRDLGVKQAPFYVLIGAEMPAILAEISFITNPKEAILLKDDKYLTTIAEQIAAGVAAYVEDHTTAALQM